MELASADGSLCTRLVSLDKNWYYQLKKKQMNIKVYNKMVGADYYKVYILYINIIPFTWYNRLPRRVTKVTSLRNFIKNSSEQHLKIKVDRSKKF